MTCLLVLAIGLVPGAAEEHVSTPRPSLGWVLYPLMNSFAVALRLVHKAYTGITKTFAQQRQRVGHNRRKKQRARRLCTN